jgi:twinkle protein
LASIDRGIAHLDKFRKTGGVIDGDSIDWNRYMRADDKSRIIPAEMLAEQCKREMMLGAEAEPGLTLPWEKTRGKVLMRPGKLSVWAGWSRHGKTQMLKQVMLHGISQGEKVLFASMEEEVHEVFKDMAQLACLERDAKPSLLDKFTHFITGNLWIYDQQGMIDGKRIQAVIRYAAKELKVTHAVVDSLMMLQVGRDDYEAQAQFVGELKTTAKDTGVHIHLVAHTRKREGKTGEDLIPSLHDVAGGHEIASKADSVFIVWKDLERNDPTKNDAVLKVDKQRGRVNWRGKILLNSHETSRQFVDGMKAKPFWGDDGIQF